MTKLLERCALLPRLEFGYCSIKDLLISTILNSKQHGDGPEMAPLGALSRAARISK
jgi:hypothetical protein